MPILAIKDNPPSRFPNVPITATKLNWYIAKVKPRQEKALAFDLMFQETGYYLPLFTKSVKRQDTGKKRTSILPLFPSYLPFECDQVPTWLIRSDRVSTILQVKAQARFKQQLNEIYLARECGLGLTPIHESGFEIGQSVKIINGPCNGLIGKLIKKNNENVLVIQIEGLGIAGIHVDASNLEAIDAPLAERQSV
ncbi:MAG TPA: transcription termination/antitermination NusG family protein [Fibrobacteria bacterium]|nr:transcription termination/antitermination NusG family protein [Fibrobacteria bacterium]